MSSSGLVKTTSAYLYGVDSKIVLVKYLGS